jgi:hypothetical protein
MVYGFLRSDENSSVAIIINNDTKAHIVKVPIAKKAVIELLTEKEFIIKDGILEIKLDAMSGAALR